MGLNVTYEHMYRWRGSRISLCALYVYTCHAHHIYRLQCAVVVDLIHVHCTCIIRMAASLRLDITHACLLFASGASQPGPLKGKNFRGG